MVAKVRKVVKYDITLTQEELSYLKSMLQNYHGNPSNEPQLERELRSDLFDGLNNIDELSYHKAKSQKTVGISAIEAIEDEIDFNDGSDNAIEVEVVDEVKTIEASILEDEDGLYD